MSSSAPQALVLTGDGINCEGETAYALTLSGFSAEVVHVCRLLQEPGILRKARLLVLPGGFSFGDEIASGKVLALKLRAGLGRDLDEYVSSGRLILGICNGFQALVQMRLLSGALGDDIRSDDIRSDDKKNIREQIHDMPRVSLVRNSGGRFLNKWVLLKTAPEVASPFFQGLDSFELPIRHGEGRLIASAGEDNLVSALSPLRYAADVNGSLCMAAALTNKKGNILGLMPHPEAFVRASQHPAWTRRRRESQERECEEIPAGLTIFKNARSMV